MFSHVRIERIEMHCYCIQPVTSSVDLVSKFATNQHERLKLPCLKGCW